MRRSRRFGPPASPLLCLAAALLVPGLVDPGGPPFAAPQTPEVTTLTSLSYGDVHLKRLRAEVEANVQSAMSERYLAQPLRFVRYRVRKGENFYQIMARVSQNADTLASLNDIVNPAALSPGTTLIIPNARGVFEKGDREKIARRYRLQPGQLRLFRDRWFVPGGRFSRSRLDYFLGRGFHAPLRQGRITSRFGVRLDPFTRRATFHGGLDIAAPGGTPVYASREGQVVFAGQRGGYGKLVILKHQFGYSTYYGHLSKILVSPGARVKAGALIAQVGSTGRSTGPHLHFEVRKQGVRKRPRFHYGRRF